MPPPLLPSSTRVISNVHFRQFAAPPEGYSDVERGEEGTCNLRRVPYHSLLSLSLASRSLRDLGNLILAGWYEPICITDDRVISRCLLVRGIDNYLCLQDRVQSNGKIPTRSMMLIPRAYLHRAESDPIFAIRIKQLMRPRDRERFPRCFRKHFFDTMKPKKTMEIDENVRRRQVSYGIFHAAASKHLRPNFQNNFSNCDWNSATYRRSVLHLLERIFRASPKHFFRHSSKGSIVSSRRCELHYVDGVCRMPRVVPAHRCDRSHSECIKEHSNSPS